MSLTLHKRGVADDEAFSFVQGTEKMAGQNVIPEIRVQYAKRDAQQREINSLRLDNRRGLHRLGDPDLGACATGLAANPRPQRSGPRIDTCTRLMAAPLLVERGRHQFVPVAIAANKM